MKRATLAGRPFHCEGFPCAISEKPKKRLAVSGISFPETALCRALHTANRSDGWTGLEFANTSEWGFREMDSRNNAKNRKGAPDFINRERLF
jgi:hypothetical protein